MNFIGRSIAKARLFARKVNKFLGFEVWNQDGDHLSKTKAKLWSDTRVVMRVLETFQSEKIGFQSVALSYFCMMAFIPLLAVAFAITGGFGLEGKLQGLLYMSGLPQEIVDSIMNAAVNIIDSASTGLFGLINALMFIWVIIWMMMRVEVVFNNVWKIKKTNRKFVKRLGVDIIIMILTPFVVLIFASGTIVYSHLTDLIFPNWIGATEAIKSFLGWVIFGAVSVLTLSAMYKFIPATDVRYRHALKAAMLAGIVFTILQYLYLETQVMVMRLNTVYGTIAIIPLFMIWLRYGWLIILYGAEFSYSFQKEEERVTKRDRKRKLKAKEKELAKS